MKSQKPLFLHTDTLTLIDESQNAPIVGGNKIRKLWGILGDEAHKGLLTYGSRYSSHCVATAYCAAKLGIPARLIVLDDSLSTINYAPMLRLCLRLGAQVVPVEANDAYEVIAEERKLYNNYRWIAGGGHELAAAEAYRVWFKRLIGQNSGLNNREWIALPLGTGTTALGIAQAVVDAGLHTRIIGVSVAREKEQCLSAIAEFGWDAAAKLIEVINDFSGQYGKILGDETDASLEMLQKTGVMVDPVYNVRVAQYIMRNNMKNGIIINTGGQHNLYA